MSSARHRLDFTAAVVCLLAALANIARAADGPPSAPAAAELPPFALSLDRAAEDRILALDPSRIPPADVKATLSLAPAPRIIALQGSFAPVTMEPFAEFLIAMGYPEQRIRNPRDGALSYGSFTDGAHLAGTLAWYYQREGMMPMLIGHSQGGMMAVRVLHELAGDFGHAIVAWSPLSDAADGGTSVVDPVTGASRPISSLKVPYAAAIATGTLPRTLLGQWDMVKPLHEIPDTVVEFTGYSLRWDLIAGNFGRIEPYRATGTAEVRNVTLPPEADHIRMPLAVSLALDPTTRAWIDDYSPDGAAPPPKAAAGDGSNIVHAADIWYSVKKHWCLEAQRLVREHRATERQ